jgi:hypothetical protein
MPCNFIVPVLLLHAPDERMSSFVLVLAIVAPSKGYDRSRACRRLEVRGVTGAIGKARKAMCVSAATPKIA